MLLVMSTLMCVLRSGSERPRKETEELLLSQRLLESSALGLNNIGNKYLR